MKSLFLIVIISKFLRKSYYTRVDNEPFLLFKCLIYLFISSIHSIIIKIPLPIGAAIMLIISLFDTRNKKVKLAMIAVGVLVVVLSIFNYQSFAYPMQKLYLFTSTHNTEKIEVYSHTPEVDNFLFDVTQEIDLNNWIDSLKSSSPSTSWSRKALPNDNTYLLKLYSSNETIDIFVSADSSKHTNVFIGNHYISYSNSTILSFISKLHPDTPSVLTINTSKDSSVNITNSTLLNILWKDIVWNPKEALTPNTKDSFTIPAYLFFDTSLGCKLFFSSHFESAYIQNKGIITLSPYLQNMLSEQFVLSQLDIVKELDTFNPAHLYNKPSNSINFSIEPSDNNLYYGLYREDYKTHEKTLLHTVSSPNTKYFLLNNPYILLLDEKTPTQHVLMLINQNIPDKHRYISKNQNILTHSISICPQNIKFTYIVENQDNTTLYFVDNYYYSPQPIATGLINDSLFLSDEYIVFTQEIDGENSLCIYSTIYSKIIKYILIPGNITFIDGGNDRVYFTVQSIDNLNLKQGIFYIDTNLTLQKADSLPNLKEDND